MSATKPDFERLHQIFFRNANPAMLNHLAHHLGVTTDSLRALEVGWAPVVTFTPKQANGTEGKKVSYGWWTVPFRDAGGKITGLALRSREDDKVVYPGSTPGCMYAINPNHRKGEQGYVNGPDNWDRTNAANPCPVCGKPDGCLVAKTGAAALCRVMESSRPMPNANPPGWLHILTPEGDLSGEPLLAGKGPVLAVEGMSDVAAAHSLGYAAVGRPSNTGGLKILPHLVRDRPVLVIGENDKKADGKWPGQDGMVAAFRALKDTHTAKMLMPPKGVKDLRSWVVTNRVTREEFDAYVEKHAEDALPGTVLTNNEPGTVANAFRKDCGSALIQWAGVCYTQKPRQSKYESISDRVLKAQFRKWARGKQFLKHTKNGDIPEHLVATRATVADWLEALDEFTLLPDDQIPPCWINDAAGPVACDMVVFKNGVLDVSGYITGEKHRTIAPSPNLFTLSAIPYDFDPDAKCPAWLTFLEKTLGASDKIALLQEYAGLCLVPDSQYQKFLYLMGRSGSGKGTVLSGFRNFLGEENVRSAQTKDFLADFGTQASMGKRVTIFSDARLHGGNAASFLENLLTMTGEDSPGIRRKFLPDAPGQSINCQWMFASNGVLDLEDTAEALPRRVMLLTFDGDFTGDRADTSLRKKHFAERQGIANWALEGLKRLRHRGDFTVPESSKVAMEEWRHETNPARMFIDECCVLDPTAKIDLNMVLDAAQAWCKKQKGGSSSWCKGRPTLERSLKTASDGKIKRTGSKQPPYTHTFSGITLTGAAETRLLGKPGGAK